MEMNCPKEDANIAARSSEPFIQIDSIFIDLISSHDIIDCGKCEHFSIRQFVSETRKKDWKIGWPFAFNGNQESEDQTSLLPPLKIPNFSWWRCPNCQREMSSKDFHHIPKLGSPEKNKISHSTKLTDSCNPCLRTEDEANMEIQRFSISEPKTKSIVALRCMNDSVAPTPESNGFRESCQTCHGSCGIGVLEHINMNVKVNSENQSETFQTGKKISVDDDCRVLFQASDIDRVSHSAVTVGDQANGSPCTEINRRKLSASEFGNDIQESHVHKSNGSLRRKIRKLRLLTELLGENRSMKKKHVEVGVDSLSNEMSDASTGQDTLYIPPSQLVIHGKSSSKSRKRKIPRDGEWKPREITSCNKNKNIMALKEDVRVNDCMKSSEYVNPSQTGLQTTKSLLRKNMSDGDYISCKKKYKKARELNPDFPLSQFGENDQQKNQEKRGTVYSWMDSFSALGAKSKSKSSITKKEGKMEVKEVEENPVVLDKCLLRLGSTSRMGNEAMTAPFQSREDGFSERRGLSLSQPSFWPQHGGTRGLVHFSGKPIVNSRPTESHFTPPALVADGMPFPTETQQLTPQLEDSVCFTLQRMGIAGPSSCKKKTEVEEVMASNKTQNCKAVDKVYERGAADDIPMEIVELMAKYQFERKIEYAENKKRLPETMSTTSNVPTPYHANSQKQESQAKYKINGVVAAREVMGPNKQNSVGYLSHISGSHVTPNLGLQQMQSSVQYSAGGSSNGGNAHKENNALGGYGKGLLVSSQNEEQARLYSQKVLEQLPFGYNIPQNCSFKSISADKASTRDRVEFHTENSINVEKKNSGYGLQSLGRTNRESAVNSLDFGSNETIPAMHLLTLMDAGMQSRKSFSGFGIVPNNKIDPLRCPSSDRYSQVHPSACFPAPTLDICTSSQHGIRASNFSAQFASKFQKKGAAKRPKKCLVTKDARGSDIKGGLAVHNVKNCFFHPADSKLVKKNSFSQSMVEDSSLPRLLICTVNRNPSDFSLPEAGNIYTIGASDLKFRQNISHRNQIGSTDGGKRKRKAKHNAAKESARLGFDLFLFSR